MHPFNLIYERADRVFENWESWFDPDVPDEEAYPSDLVNPIDEALAMLERGEVLWQHPGWVKNLGYILWHWSREASTLIKLRLTCDWLASTLPCDPLDEELASRVRLIASGQFCEAFEGEYSHVYRDPEAHLRELRLNEAKRSLDWQNSIEMDRGEC